MKVKLHWVFRSGSEIAVAEYLGRTVEVEHQAGWISVDVEHAAVRQVLADAGVDAAGARLEWADDGYQVVVV